MVQSAHSFWPPRPLRMSPVNTLQHIGKLRRCDDDDTICRRRPDELAALQSLGVERHAETVVPKNLDEIATAAAKGEKIAGVRIALQRLLHLQGKTIHAAAHVGMAGRDPYTHTRGNGNHRRGNAFITAATRPGSAEQKIRNRMPRPNSSSRAACLQVTGLKLVACPVQVRRSQQALNL
jgi:hypothetical protein